MAEQQCDIVLVAEFEIKYLFCNNYSPRALTKHQQGHRLPTRTI